jgi:hypothetical protein
VDHRCAKPPAHRGQPTAQRASFGAIGATSGRYSPKLVKAAGLPRGGALACDGQGGDLRGYDLKSKTPNISLAIGDNGVLLTWDEARDIARMLAKVANLAEFG